MRWLALVTGVALVTLAFGAATRVADTREGLVAEIITLLGGMVGVSLLIYGLAARRRTSAQSPSVSREIEHRPPGRRSRKDVLLGVGGIGLALVLLAGLAASGGFWWAVIGAVLLVPMVSGSVYLCVRYLRASP
ncbi:MAG TPA: hypothetical protein VJP81_06115 [Candidatus Dormibacteraeota bacterium]|nr:hypothetical protein [Candidatus Dormibacteraeota bacterium]